MQQRDKMPWTVNNAQIVQTSSYKTIKTRTQIAVGRIQALTQSLTKVWASIQKAAGVEGYNP